MQTVEVKVPVQVACVSNDQLPKMPKTAMDPKQNTKQLAAAVAVDVTELQDYAVRADALLRACAQGAKP